MKLLTSTLMFVSICVGGSAVSFGQTQADADQARLLAEGSAYVAGLGKDDAVEEGGEASFLGAIASNLLAAYEEENGPQPGLQAGLSAGYAKLAAAGAKYDEGDETYWTACGHFFSGLVEYEESDWDDAVFWWTFACRDFEDADEMFLDSESLAMDAQSIFNLIISLCQ